MTKVVQYFKPGKDGKKFYKEEIYHRYSAYKFATEYWEKAYGKGYYEEVVIERVA